MPVSRRLEVLRLFGLVEATSLLVLLFIAMPLKYAAGISMAVTVVGALHGLLFLIYVVMTVWVWIADRLSFGLGIAALVAGFLPFGGFVLHVWLKRRFKSPVSQTS